ATLARHLPPALPLLVTTVTPTGQERARAAFRDRGAVAYLPFDLGLPVSRFYDRLAPRALVLVEGDYWPLVLRAARRRRLPVVVVNGRVSDRTFPRLRRLRPLLGPLFGAVDRFGMQTAADRDRLLALGVPAERITVTGNLKFETPPPAVHPELEARLRALAGGRAVLLAGSTMAGEEEAVLDAHAAIGAGRALLLLAPRHPERWDPVAALVAARAPGAVRRSALPEAGQPPAVLLDSLGELAGLYRLADAAFVGGTLVPTGGHNPLEPARFGVPTAVGPSMENFREIAAAFDGADAWARVADAAGLAAAWRGWLDDPEAAAAVGARARALIATHRGAVARTLELLAEATGLFPPPVAEAPE
ncbi:MAG TPA: glycosyltransferase N-terminal domain-containing protein, partial [Thermoanaerobaculia bacterium]|nr:glycosyltransferase N-terminal domain-containing protein [Thermoanaerobaculia bacterium]